MDISPAFNAYSGVEIIVDENTSYFSGSEAGRVLTIENPWGTQEQADNILSSLRGFTYQPYTATSALLDPAAELGDGVTINQIYSGVFSMSRTYGALTESDIEAPQDEEIDHEYPYEPREDREITRRFSAIESEFRIQSNEISAKVSQTGGDNSSVSWSLTSDAWTVKANGQEVFRIDRDGATVTGIIRATSGVIGGFNIGASSIWNNIDNLENAGALSDGVYIGTDGIRLGANLKIDSGGNISAVNANLSGTLRVGGSNISASSLRTGAVGGNSYTAATVPGTSSYPSNFTCGSLITRTSASVYGLLYANGGLRVGGHTVEWGSITVGGVSYPILTY